MEHEESDAPHGGFLSMGDRMAHAQHDIEIAVSLGKSKPPEPEWKEGKSYADKDYGAVQLHENGNVEHPYDADCPYCHNLKESDRVALGRKIRTEDAMKYGKES